MGSRAWGLGSGVSGLRTGLVAEGKKGGGEAIGVMADVGIFAAEITDDAADAEGLDAVNVGKDWCCTFSGIAGEGFPGEAGGVDDGIVEDGLAGVFVDAFDMFGSREAEALICLAHEIADIDADAACCSERMGNVAHEKVGDERGVERARTDGDEVGESDGFKGLGQGRNVFGLEHELGDAEAAGGDVGFAADFAAIVHAGDKGGVGGGDGIDAAAGGEDFGSELNGLAKVAGDFSEGGDEEVAKVVALERVALAEAVIEEAREQVFFFAEGNHAVAKVARGQHVEVLAQPAGGTTIVGDGDKSC